MSVGLRGEDVELPLSSWLNIDQLCLDFEDAWRSGAKPRIEDFLKQADPSERSTLLEELASLEIDLRENVEWRDVLALQERFPDYPEAVERVRAYEHSVRFGLVPDERVDRYVVKRMLGKGSNGTVHLAWDPQLNRHVVIKLPREDCVWSEQSRQCFLDEARAAASVKHSGIVQIYDVSQTDDGRPFVVMEYVDGQSLKELMQQQPISIDRAGEIAGQMAEAIAKAHQAGLVHRDLHPGNILIGSDELVRITDFGLAIHDSEQRNRAGEYAGTLAYMSPEQVQRLSHQLDGRADIWAIGVMFYEMLTSQRPFQGETVEQLSGEIIDRPAKPPRQINPAIPQQFEKACQKCLSKHPDGRFSTARDLAAELRVDNSFKSSDYRRLALYGLAVVFLLAIATAFLSPLFRSDLDDLEGNRSEIGEQDRAPQLGSARQLTADLRLLAAHREEGWNLPRILGAKGTLPLTAVDRLLIELQVSRPSYVYLVWIDSEGQATPIYPWRDFDWNSREQTQEQHAALKVGSEDNAFTVNGAQGVDTIVLLARDAPLKNATDLPALLENLPAADAKSWNRILQFQNGNLMPNEFEKDRTPGRARDSVVVPPIIREREDLLHTRLKEHFPLIRTLHFPNPGEETVKNNSNHIEANKE